MIDPREKIIKERFRNIKRIVSVAAGKGGVGKTLIATSLALALSRRKYKVGLFDLDFYGPSCHVVLGVKDIFPKEEKGIIPPTVYNISLMSIIFFAKEEPLPLRGKEVSDAIIELMAITRWGSLDFLIIDLPPGIGEETLEVIRFLRDSEFLLITTPSKLSLEVVQRLIKLLKSTNVNILGLIENMAMNNYMGVSKKLANKNGIQFLGSIRFDKEIEPAIGNPEKLVSTQFFTELEKIVERIFLTNQSHQY
ncbi:MAG: P-loop NTPase [Candidatus Njordarchaeales archaeon]